MSKVIGMVGSRRRNSLSDYEDAGVAFLTIYEEGDTLVSGGCPQGGDKFAEVIAIRLVNQDLDALRLLQLTASARHAIIREVKAPIILHLADWNRYGRSAGFNRNTYIARDADILIALPSSNRTGGTEDTIRKFLLTHQEDKLILV